MRRVALSLAIISVIGNLVSAFSSSASAASLTSPRTSLSQEVPSITTMRGENQRVAFGTITTPNQSHVTKRVTSIARAGAASPVEDPSDEKDIGTLTKYGNLVASFWAAGGFVAILLNSIRRLVPPALEPFKAGAEGATASPLTQFQLAAYVLTCIWFAYVEGYKGFQRKFSPMVVSRSFTLKFGESPIHHFLFGPFYAMGLFHATKKRLIVSWSVTIGVALIVIAVKKLAYPWRNIVDAGVVVGLSWGSLSILLGYVMSLITGNVSADAELPEKK